METFWKWLKTPRELSMMKERKEHLSLRSIQKRFEILANPLSFSGGDFNGPAPTFGSGYAFVAACVLTLLSHVPLILKSIANSQIGSTIIEGFQGLPVIAFTWIAALKAENHSMHQQSLVFFA